MIQYVTEPVVRVRHMSRVFRTKNAGNAVSALKDVSFDIQRGEIVGLLSMSGSNTCTLLNILGLLDRPTSGSYWLDGQDVSNLSQVAQAQLRTERIGFYFQHARLLPYLSVWQNVALPLAYRQLSATEREEQAQSALAMVGLVDQASYRPAQLTSHQRQRVALARALVNNPSLLLVDETAAPVEQGSLLPLLQELHHQSGFTMLIATRNPELGRQVNRVIGLQDGQLCPNILEIASTAMIEHLLQLPASKVQVWQHR